MRLRAEDGQPDFALSRFSGNDERLFAATGKDAGAILEIETSVDGRIVVAMDAAMLKHSLNGTVEDGRAFS